LGFSQSVDIEARESTSGLKTTVGHGKAPHVFGGSAEGLENIYIFGALRAHHKKILWECRADPLKGRRGSRTGARLLNTLAKRRH